MSGRLSWPESRTKGSNPWRVINRNFNRHQPNPGLRCVRNTGNCSPGAVLFQSVKSSAAPAPLFRLKRSRAPRFSPLADRHPRPDIPGPRRERLADGHAVRGRSAHGLPGRADRGARSWDRRTGPTAKKSGQRFETDVRGQKQDAPAAGTDRPFRESSPGTGSASQPGSADRPDTVDLSNARLGSGNRAVRAVSTPGREGAPGGSNDLVRRIHV